MYGIAIVRSLSCLFLDSFHSFLLLSNLVLQYCLCIIELGSMYCRTGLLYKSGSTVLGSMSLGR